MKQIIQVEGMKCKHCEMHVEEAIKKIASVKRVKADRFSATVKIETEKMIPDSLLEASIKEAGFTYKGTK